MKQRHIGAIRPINRAIVRCGIRPCGSVCSSPKPATRRLPRVAADSPPALPPLPELETVCRVARAHFGTAGAFIARIEAGAQRVLAADGTVPEPLPDPLFADFFLPPASHDPSSDRRIAVQGANGGLPCADGARHTADTPDVPALSREPHVVAACELAAPDGTALGTLCVAHDTDLTLDAAQCALLRDLATLAERALARAVTEAALRERLVRVEEHSTLTTLALTESGTGVWDRNVETGEIHYSPTWKAMRQAGRALGRAAERGHARRIGRRPSDVRRRISGRALTPSFV